MSDNDPVQRETAEAMADVARQTRHLYLRFVAEGFTAAEALALTRTWLSTGMSQSGGGD